MQTCEPNQGKANQGDVRRSLLAAFILKALKHVQICCSSHRRHMVILVDKQQ